MNVFLIPYQKYFIPLQLSVSGKKGLFRFVYSLHGPNVCTFPIATIDR